MGISDWFTIFGLLLAVYALYSSEERTILKLKLKRHEPAILIAIIFVILVLVKYNEILNRVPWLDSLRVSYGLQANNWALIILLCSFGYFGWKLLLVPQQLPSKDLIEYYRKFMRRGFDSFFNLFNKYEQKATNKLYFKYYKSIIFDPVFIESNTKEPYYYLEYIDIIDDESFKIYFKHLINNGESIFYEELRSNNDSSLVNESNSFLYKLLHERPALFIKIGGLEIIRDWYFVHLQNEKIRGAQSSYNQPTNQLINNLELHFPLYLHLLFIQLLYQEAIEQQVDLDSVADQKGNMQSILANLVEKCVEGIDYNGHAHAKSKEYPTHYHLIIGKIFGVIRDWFRNFNDDDHYYEESSYNTFFPFCLSLCIKELIIGFEKKVISTDFLCRQLHYHMFSIYYRYDLKPTLLQEIEKECIVILPKSLLKPILKYTFDQEFAMSYENFAGGNFRHPGSNAHEMIIIQRLYNLLKENELFD